MQINTLLLASILLLSFPVLAADTTPPTSTAISTDKDMAVAFPDSLQWLNTPAPLTLQQFKGKFLLLSFWTSSSTLSTGQQKQLKSLKKDNPGLEVVIIHSGKYDSERITDNIRNAVIENDIVFPVANDSAFTLWNAYGIEAWPSNVLINPEGEVVARSQGVELNSDIQSEISKYKGKLKAYGAQAGSELQHFRQGLLLYPSFIESDHVFSLFVTESRGHRIVQTDFSGTVEHSIGAGTEGYRDGSMHNAQFSFPKETAYDAKDSILYIADSGNDAIRAYHLKTGEVTTVLGNGSRQSSIPKSIQGTDGGLNQPTGLELLGNDLYIAMTGWNQIWKLDTKTLLAEPVAGSGKFGFEDGKDQKCSLAEPYALTSDPEGIIYFTEMQSSAVRMLKNGKVSTLVGTGVFEYGDEDGRSSKAKLQGPSGIVYHNDNLYVADEYNNKIKQVDPYSGKTETLIGASSNSKKQLNHPSGIAVLRNELFIADKYNQLIRRYEPSSGEMEIYQIKNVSQFSTTILNNKNVFETDTILIPNGASAIDIKLMLDSNWVIARDLPQTVSTPGRNTGISILKNGLNEESQTVTFMLENPGSFEHFFTDFQLYYHPIDQPERIYLRSFTLMVLMQFSDRAEGSQETIVKIATP